MSTVCWRRSSGSTSPPRRRRAGRLVASARSHATAADLEFSTAFENSLDAVSDRDFVAEALFDLALVAIHLRGSARSGCCGPATSSASPARRRLRHRVIDDAAEEEPGHRRAGPGRAGRLIGDLTGLLVTLKGLPLALQPRPAGGQGAAVRRCGPDRLGARRAHGMIATATFDSQRMQAAADAPALAATDLAEWLVERGVPFRDAHAVVGTLVRRSLAGEGQLATSSR